MNFPRRMTAGQSMRLLPIIGLATMPLLSSSAPVASAQEHAATTSAPAPSSHSAGAPSDHEVTTPSVLSVAPFVIILLGIALLPLIPATQPWWHHNSNKLILALSLSAVTLGYYFLRGYGMARDGHHSEPGLPTVLAVIEHAVLADYIPFIILLFSLYTICGGIQLNGDLRATPAVNSAFLAIGALLASLVGTTGASMLLIRPVLQTNKERAHVKHTVIFFIFLASNIGGCLLPIGDPPLFLGYLKGVPFLWTLQLWKEWLFCTTILLAIYFVWDSFMYKKEPPAKHLLDETQIEPLRLAGGLNFAWLAAIVLAVALIVPGKGLLGTSFIVPTYLREAVMLMVVALAWFTSSPAVRQANEFNFGAIVEVAALFIGIFICMQAPVEILNIQGPNLPLHAPAHFFWASGGLSSFLDNAPTYVVFFETANSLTHHAGKGVLQLLSGHFIREDLLAAVSLGSVFMGANTYIGNGPNFMVKSIAEQSGVKMPSFFGYMAYSVGILIPVFILVTVVFFHLLG